MRQSCIGELAVYCSVGRVQARWRWLDGDLAQLSGYTNRGVCFPLTRARTASQTGPRTKLQHQDQIQAREINSLKDPSTDQEDQGEPEKQDTTRRRTSLAGQASLARLGLPRKRASKIAPAGLPGLTEANHSTTPPHSDARRRSVRCQAPKSLSGCSLPHGSHFLRKIPPRDTLPETC